MLRKARRELALVAVIAVAASVFVGCARSASSRPAVRPAADEEAVEGGPGRTLRVPFALATPEDAIVRVVAPTSSCSGTLIDEDLVLTAHHCVVRRDAAGELTRTLDPVDGLTVELGGDDLAWGKVGVKAIVAPPCGHGGGSGDVAVLVLERKLVGVATMTPRLDGPPQRSASDASGVGASTRAGSNPAPKSAVTVVDPIGFGRCATSSGGVHRRGRLGGPIEGVERGTFHLRAAICPGDSGGPMVVRGTSEVVGVVSMSAMDADERTAGLSVAARIDAVRAVFAQARAIADGASPAELPPLVCP